MTRSGKYFRTLVAITTLTFFVSIDAAVERITDYEYDEAGNVVRILTFEQSDPPTVSPLDPIFINLGRTVVVTATGTNLYGVDVSTAVPGLSISAVDSTGDQVSFELTADAQAQLGPAAIFFTTGLGQVQQSIEVAEAGPDVTTHPDPISIDDAGAITSVTLTFSEPRPEDETYSISTSDAAIADTSGSSFTILSGQTQATVSLTGVSAGATSLQVDLPAKFYTYTFSVFVGDNYAELAEDFPDMLQRNLFATPVGVTMQRDNPFLPNTVTSGPVGVLVDSNAAIFSRPVGIFYGDGLAGSLIAQPVGVLVSDTVSYAYTPPIGVVYGAIIDGSQPASLAVGTTIDVVISGFNLTEVTSATVNPGDDLTLGAFSVDAQGTTLTLPITIDPLAATGPREILLQDGAGPVPTRSGSPITIDIQ